MFGGDWMIEYWNSIVVVCTDCSTVFNQASAQHELVGLSEEKINTLNLQLEKRNNPQLGNFLYFENAAEKVSVILDTTNICRLVVIIPVDKKAMYNRLKILNTSPNLIKASDGVWKYVRKSTIITISYLEEGEIAYFSCRETLD